MLLVGAILLAVFVLPPGWGIAGVTAGIVIELAEVAFWVRFLRRYRVRTGSEALIGRRAEVVVACRPAGQVRVNGELWGATCEAGADVGDETIVRAVNRLTLVVEKVPATDESAAALAAD